MKRFFLDYRLWAVAMAVLVALCGAFAGWKGALGSAMGLLGFGVGVIGLRTAVKAMTLGTTGGWLAVVVFLGKLPLFLLTAWASVKLGGPVPACFLIGGALVYLLLVGWGQATASPS